MLDEENQPPERAAAAPAQPAATPLRHRAA